MLKIFLIIIIYECIFIFQAEQTSAPTQAVASESATDTDATQATTSTSAVSTKAVAEPDPWDFADPVDILPKLPDNFNEMVASKKWQERKEALEALLTLATDNVRLDPKANYNEIAETLSKVRVCRKHLISYN